MGCLMSHGTSIGKTRECGTLGAVVGKEVLCEPGAGCHGIPWDAKIAWDYHPMGYIPQNPMGYDMIHWKMGIPWDVPWDFSWANQGMWNTQRGEWKEGT